jgi:hypothetical protein
MVPYMGTTSDGLIRAPLSFTEATKLRASPE